MRNWPDLGPRFINGEMAARVAAAKAAAEADASDASTNTDGQARSPQRQAHQQPPQLQMEESVTNDKRDLDWATVLKRTFEAYIRGEAPNMYGEWLNW